MIRRPSSFSHSLSAFLGITVALGTLGLHGQTAPGFVYESATEFQTLADVDGDGRPDLVVADKATGEFRIANGANDGALIWRTHAGDSGLGTISGFSAGPLLDPGRDSLLFADPLANRIQIIDTPTDSRLTEPLRVPVILTGPALVTAINLPDGPGGYDKNVFDIVYHATLFAADLPNTIGHLRNDGSPPPFEEFAQFAESNPAYRANRVQLEAGGKLAYGVMEDLGSASALRLYDPSTSPINAFTEVTGLSVDSAYVYADFNNDGLAQFIFFTPGSSTLHESQWDGTETTAPTSFDYPEPVEDLHVIESGDGPELLIVHADGTAAERVKYNSGGKIVPQETLNIANGQSISGAHSIGNKLHLLAADQSGVSGTAFTYEFDGNSHRLLDKQRMTPLNGSTRGSSVLLFDGSPLTDPDARLLSRLDAGPWTSVFSIDGGEARVSSERFRGTTEGLGDKEEITIASTPAATVGGLTNQTANDFSLRFFDNPVGEVAAQLTIEPASGTYSQALRPTLAVNAKNAAISYRTSQQPDWIPYETNPPVIATDTTLYAVAEVSGGFSNVVKVEYTFTQDPGSQDSNADGLPDFVAQAYGLDPLAETTDSDGDGFTDFQEILAGTDPSDPLLQPTRADASFEYPNAFNLVASPAAPDPDSGALLLRPFAEGGAGRPTRMKVHQPNGFFLGGAPTDATPLLADPAASFNALSIVESDLFVIATTEANFPVDDGAPQDYGRQVAAIVSNPALDFTPFTYEDFGALGGYGDLAAEAEAWLTAALAYYDSLTRPTVTADTVGSDSTLSLLLIEKFLGEALLARDLIDRSNISLTPFRRNENPLAPNVVEDPVTNRDRTASLGQLLALQRSSGDDTPSYKIKDVVQTVHDAVAAASGANVQQLIEVARRLYTTSATNTSIGSLRQPLDALRRFIRTGDLVNTGYDAAPASANFPADLLTDAAAGVAEIEGLIEERELVTIDLFYSGGPIDPNCPLWQEVVYTTGDFDPENPVTLSTNYELVDDQDQPFPVARAFPLTAGSVFTVTGFVEPATACGDVAIEVIPQPSLTFLRNSPAQDTDSDLIPDAIQDLAPATPLSPFADTDGDGYSDLQEILVGSDPTDTIDSPSPAPILDLTPPRVVIENAGAGASNVSFDFPAEFAPHIEFQLYSSADLQEFSPTGKNASHTSAGRHELTISQGADAEFYIFRMSLK